MKPAACKEMLTKTPPGRNRVKIDVILLVHFRNIICHQIVEMKDCQQEQQEPGHSQAGQGSSISRHNHINYLKITTNFSNKYHYNVISELN